MEVREFEMPYKTVTIQLTKASDGKEFWEVKNKKYRELFL
jgi:hypothetical protein